jgi:hypothetical protein
MAGYGSKVGSKGGGGMIKAPSPKGATVRRARTGSGTFKVKGSTASNLASRMRAK